MQVLRLNEVLTRVVAWHNRHPLARRVQASQVHSIGEVQLPFASARPWIETAALATSPEATATATPTVQRSGESLAEVVSARAAARPAALAASALPGLEVLSVLPDTDDGVSGPAESADFDPFAAASSAAAGSEDGAEDNAETAPSAAGPASLASDEPAPELPPVLTTDDAAAPNPDSAETPATEPVDITDPAHIAVEPAPAAAVATTAEPAGHPIGTDPAVDPPTDPDVALAFSAAIAEAAALTPDLAGTSAAQPHIDPSPVPEDGRVPMAHDGALAWAPEVRVGWLRRLWARLTGRRPGWPRLEAAFSRDFIWPLTPRQVARWAQRHGQPQSMAPADWPRRQVDPDLSRLGSLRQAGLPHTVHLHLLTAAIGVGDRRIRVLLDADGHIIGPRAYSRPRVASAAGLLVAGLLAANWPWGGPGPAAPMEAAAPVPQEAQTAQTAQAASAAASTVAGWAAGQAASAASVAADGGHAVTDLVASAREPAAAASSPATEHHLAPTTEGPAAPRAAGQAAPTGSDLTAPTTRSAAVAVDPSVTEERSATVDAANAAGATVPLGRIRPTLSDEDKRIARQQAAQWRTPPDAKATTPNTAPTPVYALVTRPTPDRQAASDGLALMRSTSARLTPPVPDHGELMQTHGDWRAAWWPFASQADAERARVLLASRGLKAEVVEF